VNLGGDLVQGLVFLLLSVVLFTIATYVKDFLTPYKIQEQLGKNNLAVSVSMTGYLLAVVIVILGAFLGPAKNFIDDIGKFIGYAVLGILLLNISRFINDKFLLRKFCNVKELIDEQNVGAGAVEFGAYIASGLVVAGSIHGEGGGVHTALAFFVLSQVALIVFTFLYDLITPFDVHDEIEKGNVAAGVAFGGTLAALGVILLKGTVGDFIGWRYNLINFALSAGSSLIFLPLVRMLLDKILLPNLDLNHAISRDRNVAVGCLEMTVAVSFAVILYFSIDFDLGF
jgi:uncharacterized membrane protein YjfL (UPF0719 family)